MSNVLHMYTDLVRAPGMNAELYERINFEILQHFVVRDRLLASLMNDHCPSFCRMLGNRRINGSFFLCWTTNYKRLVGFFCFSLFELSRQISMCGLILCINDHAAGLPVKAMHSKY